MNEPHDLHDRLVDCALCEVAGGHAPPDLSARIVAAVDTPVTPIEDTKMERPKRTRRVWFALATAACLLIGAGFLLPAMQRSRELAHSNTISNTIELQGTTNGSLPKDAPNEGEQAAPMEWKDVANGREKYSKESLNQQKSGENQYWEATLQALNKPADGNAAETLGELTARTSNGESEGGADGGEGGGQQAAPPSVLWKQFDSKTVAAGKQWSGPVSPSNGQPAFEQYGTGKSVEYLGHPVASASGEGEVQQFRVTRGFAFDERNLDRYKGNADLLRTNPPKPHNAQGEGSGLPGDQYSRIYENPFIEARGEQAVSTFSIDVDTASYSNVRQFLQSGQLPPPDAVRLEELINYFDYQYEAPPVDSETPFSTAMEVAGCPWEPKHRLVRVALQGRELDKSKRPVSNLVFLIDVSGSMNDPNKLPLVVEGMKQLVRELGENDRVAIVVYASSEGLVLPSTPGTEQATILEALDRLQAGGSTAGGAGIQLAYQMAEDHFVKRGVNRVILCTDGDFNVGVTSTADLERMVEQKAKDTKVFLSVLGFGRGNLNDAMMETISNHGNGNYHYVDNLTEARKVLVEEMTGTLVTIAKDVKIQVEFNPAQVAGYRLLGYENRMLRTEDFNDDTKDAGEIGAGHRVTALYEIVPAGEKVDLPPVDELKYQQAAKAGESAADNNELLTLKLRFKPADGDTSTKLEFPLSDEGKAFSAATPDFKFAAAVASFGMLLRDSEQKGNATFDAVLEIATEGASHDPHGYRAEFLELVRKAKSL